MCFLILLYNNLLACAKLRSHHPSSNYSMCRLLLDRPMGAQQTTGPLHLHDMDLINPI